MGHQPALDGLRALSLVAVVLYHAGLGWQRGGFLGVEVFFVVSGFLITLLLLEEHRATGRIALREFWIRRARRLLPALGVVLVGVGLWAAIAGTPAQVTELRRDLPWALGYAANWGQVFGAVPYFATSDPPLLRHLWSLGVEEQWYVFWPPLLIALGLPRRSPRRVALGLVVAVAAVAAALLVVRLGGPDPVDLGPAGLVDRINLLYLSTPSRAGGLLLGAAVAFVWQPWTWWGRVGTRSDLRRRRRRLDVAGWTALVVLGGSFVVAELTADVTYPWTLTIIGVASTVAIGVAVHPAATSARRALSADWLVALGRRSYGLYLWHWPVFVVMDATGGDPARLLPATLVTLAVGEACFRLVEEPARRGSLGRAWHRARERDRPLAPVLSGAAGAVLVVGLGAWYVAVEPFDIARGGESAVFVLDADDLDAAAAPGVDAGTTQSEPDTADPRVGPSPTAAPPTVADAPSSVPAPIPSASPGGAPSPDPTPSTTAPPEPVVPADLPVVLGIVGDSQGHSLAMNLPEGIGSTFTVRNGALNGCSVHATGRASSRRGVSTGFSLCRDWVERWRATADGADVTLVVLGAWDVLDLEVDGQTLAFGTPGHDALLRTNLATGLDALAAGGSRAALLEVACMRPVDVEGAGVPALPERGEDERVAHLNQVLRGVAAGRDDTTFVEGPDAWCQDETIATDLAHRWDGVHVYVPGANLIYTTIAADLLTLAA